MAEIVRKSGQIIFQIQPPSTFTLIMTILGSIFICPSLIVTIIFIVSANTLEISCNKIEPRLIDCKFTKIRMLGILPRSTNSYKGIKGVKYYNHYIMFNQTSGENKVLLDDRASWVANRINQFLNSNQQAFQQALTQTHSEDHMIFLASSLPLLLVGLFIICFGILHISKNVNNDLRQFIQTFSLYGVLPIFRKTWNFRDIKGIALLEKYDYDEDDNRNYKVYTLEIHTNRNKKIYLWSFFNEQEANDLANEICRLTGFRLIEQRLPSSENS